MDQMLYDSVDDGWLPTRRNKLMAWSTHIFTATGALWGFLAIQAIFNENWMVAFIWMIAATLVDALDGVLARRTRVKEVVPNFDGALLDNMVDYFTYVIVPALFMYNVGLFPQQFSLLGVTAILLASAYQFCQSDAKTDDHYFKGFPSYWNVVVFYLFVLGLEPWINLTVTLALAVLVFVPIKYIYPSRTRRYQKLTITLAIIWGAICIAILMQYPEPQPWLIWTSLLFAVYYTGASLYGMITS